jgi:hypothetical protein
MSLFMVRNQFRSMGLGAIYVYQMPVATDLFAWQHLIVRIAPIGENGIPDGKRPPKTGGLGILCL